MERIYRKLITRKGTYFVAWKPDDVAQLIVSEQLVPTDFVSARRREMHYLVRDLYLLACKGELNGHTGNYHTDLLTHYARRIHLSLHTRH